MLKQTGCDKVFRETSGWAKTDRFVLDELLGCLRSGDTFVVWWLDRFGRSRKHLSHTPVTNTPPDAT